MSDTQYVWLIIVLIANAWAVTSVGGKAVDELIRIRQLLAANSDK